jgi:hypothetical protein
MLIVAYKPNYYKSKNTACGCHPKYETTEIDSKQDFLFGDNEQLVKQSIDFVFSDYHKAQETILTLVLDSVVDATYEDSTYMKDVIGKNNITIKTLDICLANENVVEFSELFSKKLKEKQDQLAEEERLYIEKRKKEEVGKAEKKRLVDLKYKEEQFEKLKKELGK